jgi:hypothetical protein
MPSITSGRSVVRASHARTALASAPACSSASLAVWPAIFSAVASTRCISPSPAGAARNAASFSAISQVCVSASGARSSASASRSSEMPSALASGNDASRFCADSQPASAVRTAAM